MDTQENSKVREEWVHGVVRGLLRDQLPSLALISTSRKIGRIVSAKQTIRAKSLSMRIGQRKRRPLVGQKRMILDRDGI